MITEEKWKELCQKYDKWCPYEFVKDLTEEEAEIFIKLMPVWIPM